MPRTLTAARAMVRPEDEATYLALLPGRADAARRRGARFWVFRNRFTAGAFLEFTETADDSAAARSADELAIEGRMRDVAMYAPDAEELWEELQIAAAPPPR